MRVLSREGHDMEERRRYLRVSYEKHVGYHVIKERKEAYNLGLGWCRNISSAGILFASSEKIKMGAFVFLDLDYATFIEVVKLEEDVLQIEPGKVIGKVVRAQKTEEGYDVALVFLKRNKVVNQEVQYFIDYWKDKKRDICLPDFNQPFLIAGPPLIENRHLCFEIAENLRLIEEELGIPVVFKAICDKVNQVSVDAFRGLGCEKGLEILHAVRETFSLPILSEVHSEEDVVKSQGILDIIQIPGYLCRQTDILLKAAQSGNVVNVKKGQFLAPKDMKYVVDKLEKGSCQQILLTECGTFFGYHNLVVDMRSLLDMRKWGHPVIFDATHSVQSANDICPHLDEEEVEYVRNLARSAATFGVNGFFFDVHTQPEKALGDIMGVVKPSDLKRIVKDCLSIREVLSFEEGE